MQQSTSKTYSCFTEGPFLVERVNNEAGGKATPSRWVSECTRAKVSIKIKMLIALLRVSQYGMKLERKSNLKQWCMPVPDMDCG
jgi:hypothetical protein